MQLSVTESFDDDEGGDLPGNEGLTVRAGEFGQFFEPDVMSCSGAGSGGSHAGFASPRVPRGQARMLHTPHRASSCIVATHQQLLNGRRRLSLEQQRTVDSIEADSTAALGARIRREVLGPEAGGAVAATGAGAGGGGGEWGGGDAWRLVPLDVSRVGDLQQMMMDGVALAISPSLERPGTGKNTLRLRGGSTKVQNATGGGGAVAPASKDAPAVVEQGGKPNVTEAKTEVKSEREEAGGELEGPVEEEVVEIPRPKPGGLPRVPSTSLDGGRPLRVALLTWESLHTIAVGGVAPHVTELAAGLERRGHEVHVYSRTGDGQMPYEIIDGVHIHRVPIQLDPDFITECNNMCNSFCWFLSESEQFQGAAFDVCHGHDWLAAKAVVQCKNMGRNTVATIHSTEYGRCGNVNYGGQSERIRRIEEEVAFVADRVISVSGVLCDEVKQQFRINYDKLRMVYNGIHLAPYLGTVDAGSVKARYNIGPMDPLVLFVGRLATQKGPDLLVEAIPLVLSSRHDVKFAVVGDGYMRADLERRVHELGVSSAVRFLGSMSGRPLVELFKSTDCVCIPSRNEPFGIVVLEAWASGKPVVATSSGGPREFVDHGVDGYHVHPSANSISWGICEIFSNFENSRQMGMRGREKAQKKFNWDKIAQDTERIYRELAGK